MKLLIFYLFLALTASISTILDFLTTKEAESLFIKRFCGLCPAKGLQCEFNIRNIANSQKANYFNLNLKPISQNKLGITKIDVIITNSSTDYKFPGLYLKDQPMLSLVFLPKMEKPLGVIIYYHGTLFSKTNAPSYNGQNYRAIGGFFASQGYAVVFIDYIGYYAGSSLLHPYVVAPQQMIRSAVNCLNTLSDDGIWGQYYNETYRLKLYSTGFSEGGPYSIGMSLCLEFPEECEFFTNQTIGSQYMIKLHPAYIYMKSAGSEGAYDVFNVVRKFLMEDVSKEFGNPFKIHELIETNVGKPGLISLALAGYAEYTLGNVTKLADLNKDLFNLNCTAVPKEFCIIDKVKYANILQAFAGTGQSMAVGEAITNAAIGKKMFPYSIPYAQNGIHNSAFSLVKNDFLIDPTFQQSLKNATIVDYGARTQRDIFIFSLKEDSLVSPLNSLHFTAIASKNSNVKSFFFDNSQHLICELLETVDHLKVEPIAAIYTLAFISTTQQ